MGNYNWGRAVVGLSIVFRVRRIPGTVEVSGAAETTDTTLRSLTRSPSASEGPFVILRSPSASLRVNSATKDLLSVRRDWLITKDARSFATLRMTNRTRSPSAVSAQCQRFQRPPAVSKFHDEAKDGPRSPDGRSHRQYFPHARILDFAARARPREHARHGGARLRSRDVASRVAA